MEKWLIVTGIWMMCAFCAVLFIRGASRPELRRVPVSGQSRQDSTEDLSEFGN